METKSTAFSAAVPELLGKYNYAEWEIRMRTYLKGQDLWKDIINDDQDENDDDDDDADAAAAASAINNRRRNYMALHVIQISCGPYAFSQIRSFRSADTAWQTLKDKYLVRDTGNIDKSYLQYADLYRAVRRGKLNAAKEFLDSQPGAVRKAITNKGETALHIAVTFGHAHIVQKLVDLMSEEDLGIEDGDGYTALMKALVSGRSELARYLYTRTPLNDLVPAENERRKRAMLLTRAIYSTNLDLALDLIRRYPSLTHALDDRGESPLLALASRRKAFPSGNRLRFWKQWIYDHCIHIDPPALATFETRLNTPNVESGRQRNQVIKMESGIRIDQSAPAAFETHLNISNVENGRQSNQVTTINSVPMVPRLRNLVSSIVSHLLGIEQLYEMKKKHMQSKELLSCMCEEISTSFIQTGQLENIGGVYDAITCAVKNGISEFVFKVVTTDPSFLENKYRNSRNILMLAALYRQSEIFNHIYNELEVENTLTSYRDCNDDNLLHMVGMIEDSTRLNQISGAAALQMQRELQWFKEVEKILKPEIKENTNKDGLTPRELFTKNHENMMVKAEKWVKDTASSGTVVGALVVTIMFAVAFTVPGGNNQNTGFPIFLEKNQFINFLVVDVLSLFLSSSSVLVFLKILTSWHAEKDFELLLKEMFLGLFTLFFSFVTMIIAFSSAVSIMVRDQHWSVVTLIWCLPGFPFAFLIMIEYPILIEMIIDQINLGPARHRQ